MPVDIEAVFTTGGRGLVEFLQHCVMATELDPIFVFLAREYRTIPTRDKAIALFDMFCAEGALARISPLPLLPPRNLGLVQAIASLRKVPMPAVPASVETTEETPKEVARPIPPPVVLPPKYLFDGLSDYLVQEKDGALARLASDYDPALSPLENLSGGEMTAGQRQFVDRVWQPRVRPLLVQSGFRRIANI